MPESNITAAAEAVRNASALLITAGAGMGVDSGLPDFRGTEGFWKAYPPFAKLGLSFRELANPRWFITDPHLAWGFYGHRMNLYRAAQPHAGYEILHRWSQDKPAAVFTSNVDGQFQASGFDLVCEVHGSILYLQCTKPCRQEIWPAGDLTVEVDETTFRAQGKLPLCPHCGAMARPNILMFSDRPWVEQRSLKQEHALRAWLRRQDAKRLVIIEMGAGTAVPTVRYFSEDCQSTGATLVRINPREAEGPRGMISIESGAKAALEAIDTELHSPA